MSELDNVKEFIEQAVETNTKAVEMQMSFYESFSRRQGEAMAKLADQRIDSLKEIANCGSFEKAIETNTAFEQQAKENLEALFNSNVKAFEEFSDSLKTVYTV
ncbi:hypothetical protein [Oceanicoccus sagamiensis]|uniref:Phasin domain-containing protein n=1 Tax=Oceanicoccus sagamiensis TaxID=716816 RepID=A0A1X9N589_9GAMM|nr:hypothetical protein [Oceanicoccus sagamiensis]ARN72896.1 hypothetical protein BST96_01505 [Oceanicoccus sagamiensis]